MKRIFTEEQKARRRATNKAWRLANPERKRTTYKAWLATNRKRKQESVKVWRAANRETLRLKRRAHYLANREKVLLQSKTWQETNPQRCAASAKARRARNLERDLTNKKNWARNARATNLNYKLREYCRHAIQDAIRRNGSGKKAYKTVRLLGCDIAWVRAWLEVQFRPGMTWENYGPVWHIDHKRPCASFDLTDPVQQKLCFHWTNLQPLFAAENMAKHDKWESEAA